MATPISNPMCQQAKCLIDAGLKSQVLFPTDPDYKAREASYWSNAAKLKPACIVLPRSATEVSSALKALVDASQKFSIRSGGHSPGAGCSNIDEHGVTIDLSLLNNTTFDKTSNTASIGTGGRWKHVYRELQKFGRVAAGGREGNVGVGGFLLGGGNTWFTARKGWGCDNVISYEVVLANGRIVTADKDTNLDLFRALKGGSNNFGIVTNFTVDTLPSDRVWAGIAVTPKEAISDVTRLTVDFTDNLPKHPDSNLIIVIGYVPAMKDNVTSTAVLQTQGVEDDPAFDEWRKLPKIVNSTKITSVCDMAFEMTQPTNYYNKWSTLSFKNDKRIMDKASDLHDGLIDELKSVVSDGDFMTQCIFQPLPKLFSGHSVKAGGNVMGIERNTSNGIIFQITVMVRTPELNAFVCHKLKDFIARLKDYAETIDGNLEWLYLNYASEDQDVLRSYGAENVRMMKDVAIKYDPQQVFQKLCPGGWKISHVEL